MKLEKLTKNYYWNESYSARVVGDQYWIFRFKDPLTIMEFKRYLKENYPDLKYGWISGAPGFPIYEYTLHQVKI